MRKYNQSQREYSFILDFPLFSAAPSSTDIRRFKTGIWDYYEEYGRSFPWRETKDPYNILLSELMLQQTQTERVRQKYRDFTERYPDFVSLSRASLREVLTLWQGLGYNRRGKALREIGIIVTERFNGILPDGYEELLSLPMVGPYTASAIQTFAFHKLVVFIETNIRRVFLHCFYNGVSGIKDNELLSVIEISLDRQDQRNWYYALMDFGAALKKVFPNPNKKSAHYVKQSSFADSRRQVRGAILKELTEIPSLNIDDLGERLLFSLPRISECLNLLEDEGLLTCENGVYRIP